MKWPKLQNATRLKNDQTPPQERMLSARSGRVWYPNCGLRRSSFIDGRCWVGLDRGMPQDAAASLQEILGEADALIRQRLHDRGLELSHLVIAVTPDGQVVLRSNVSADVLRSFGEDLKNIADELEAPPEPGDTTH
jgi:hypothetical protein